MSTKHVTIKDHRLGGGGFELTVDGHDVSGVIAYKAEANCQETATYYPRITLELMPCSLTLDLLTPIQEAVHAD